MFVAIDGRPAGLIGVADPIKASTAEALKMLKDDGIKIVLLTGDSRITAAAVAKKLGIDHVEAEVMPEKESRGREGIAVRRAHRRDGRRRNQ